YKTYVTYILSATRPRRSSEKWDSLSTPVSPGTGISLKGVSAAHRVFMGGSSDVCPNSGRPGYRFALHPRRGHEFGSGTVRRGSSERGHARAGSLGARASRERPGPDRARADVRSAGDDRGPVPLRDGRGRGPDHVFQDVRPVLHDRNHDLSEPRLRHRKPPLVPLLP